MVSFKAECSRLFLSPPHLSGEEIELVIDAFNTNYIAPTGPMVNEFEREISELTGLEHSIALASGTAAIHTALHFLGVGVGDSVIASTLTFIGSVSPIVLQGATPIFVDSDLCSWNMDPELLAGELETCARKGRLPKAVIPTDLYGQCADYKTILNVCQHYEIPLIIDAAEAMGATYHNQHAGTIGTAATFSFNGNKIITTSGGGVLASNNKKLIDHARFVSQQARDPFPHYEHTQIGFNYRMSNILAAIGIGQLKVLDQRVKQKREIFAYYQKALGDIPGIEFMPEAPYGKSNRWLTVILIDPTLFGADRETVRLALEHNNIESRPVWKPMHLQPVFKGCSVRGGAVSEKLFEFGLCLPSGTAMSTQDLERIVDVIRSTHYRSITSGFVQLEATIKSL